ncbi:MAG: hypothetical protein WDZ84_14500 [Rhodovibrionaceae bacterium]
MLQWLSQHSDSLSLFADLAIVAVWLTYLQIFLMAHLRQRRSSILINRGAGRTIDAHCLISNMSAEPIYVQNVIAALKTDGEKWTAAVTDLSELEQDRTEKISDATSQGPLGAGELMDVGSFSRLAKRAGQAKNITVENLSEDYQAMELTVVAAYGSDKHSVAASREFEIGDDGALIPTTVTTTQIRSLRKRRQIDRYLRDFL